MGMIYYKETSRLHCKITSFIFYTPPAASLNISVSALMPCLLLPAIKSCGPLKGVQTIFNAFHQISAMQL